MDGEHNGKPYFLMDDLGGKPTIFGNIQPKFKPIWGSEIPYLFTTTRGLVTINCSLSSSNCPTERIRTETAGRGPAGGPASPIWTRNASGKEAMHVRARRCRKRFLSRNKYTYKIQNEFKLSVLEGFFESLFCGNVDSAFHLQNIEWSIWTLSIEPFVELVTRHWKVTVSQPTFTVDA